MHYIYLVETNEKPDPISVEYGIISELINPYYCEYNPDKISWDWCEIGGRWSGEIPNNCCLGSEIPFGFQFYGLITEWGCIDQDWNDSDFWSESANMDRETLAEEIQKRNRQAEQEFASLCTIRPNCWYTLVDMHG